MKYSQPDFYHFTSDSIELAKFSSKKLDLLLNKEIKPIKILDLFAGSGVVVFELLLNYLKNKSNVVKESSCNYIEVYLLEKNNKYVNHIKLNIEKILKFLSIPIEKQDFYFNIFKIVNIDFSEFDFKKYDFDLVVSNPPFFISGYGRQSPDFDRNTCLFINENEFVEIFTKLKASTHSNSEIVILLRLDLKEVKMLFEYVCEKFHIRVLSVTKISKASIVNFNYN